jgi:hypothetical protein
MTTHSWRDASDVELDAFVHAEMQHFAANAPVPELRRPATRGGRTWLPARRAPYRPRHLAPLGVALGLAVLATAGGGTWVAVQRLHNRATTASPATPLPHQTSLPHTPAPAPTIAPGPALVSTVPAGVDVVYWATAGSSSDTTSYPIEAVDWSGRSRGHILIPGPKGSSLPAASPNGQALLVDRDIYRADGAWLGRLPSSGSVMWAADSTHLCTLDAPGTTSTTLTLEVVGFDGRPVTTTHFTVSDSQDNVAMLSCTVDRASLNASPPGFTGTRYVEIDTHSGALVFDRSTTCANPNCPSVRFSPDGRYAATTQGTTTTTIEDISTGRTTRVALGGLVEAFTADGSKVLVDLAGGSSMSQTIPGLRLVDWRTATPVWSRSNANTMSDWIAPQPGGTGMAIADCQHGPSTGVFPSGPCRLDVITLSASGTAHDAVGGNGLVYFLS